MTRPRTLTARGVVDEQRQERAFELVAHVLSAHGPGSQALADVLAEYVGGDESTRGALFLALAWEAVGRPVVTRPSQAASSCPDPEPSQKTSDLPVGHQYLVDFLRSSLALIQSAHRKAEG